MSYNYDLNPWDDSGNQNQSQGQSPYQSAPGYGGGSTTSGDPYAASGYSNPSAQYGLHDAWNQNDQYNTYGDQQQQQPDQSNENYQQQEEYAQQQQPAGSRQPPGFVSRFLRAHVPLCGACMDFTSPILDILLKYVNRDLLASKIFYFFFYSAFGSLFPLMGVYFKQLGMNPAQVGILTGVRPFIEIFSAPFWNSLAEKFQKSKIILLFSLLSWIVFTYSLAHIRPPASACIAFNDTDYVLYTPYSANDLSNYEVGQLESDSSASTTNTNNESRTTNEIFMNRPGEIAAENKDEILIKEETVNDQGRRRKKRSYPARPMEQIPRPASRLSRYSYALGEAVQPIDLDIDLENDFEDTAIGRLSSDGTEVASFFESPDPIDVASSEYRDELDQQAGGSFSSRMKRSAAERGESDDLLGESEAIETSHEREESARNNEEPDEEGEERSRLRAAGPRDPHESDDEAEETEETNEHETNKKQHQEQHQTESEAEQKQIVMAATKNNNKTKRIYKHRHKTPPTHIVGMSPITVEYAVNYNKEKHGQFVTPMFSTIVYKLDSIKEVFFLLLLLISLGEFFSAPAITIADSTTLSCLGENTDLYGRQRMFGSIGWAITLLLVGMALDSSTTIEGHPCGPHQRERSYTVCFTIFSLLMGCAFITATQFKFNYANKSGTGDGTLVTKAVGDNTVITTTDSSAVNNIDDLYASTKPREIFNTAPPVNAPPPGSQGAKEKFEFLDKWKSAVFAQSTWELPEWIGVFRQFTTTLHLTYLFVTWFLGCGVGLVFTFLFWHLQDVGGTPTLFGICSVINHISEILAYFFSSYFIKRFGHTKVSLTKGLAN